MAPVYDSRHRSVAPSAYSRASVYSYYSSADNQTWTDQGYSRERDARAGNSSRRASSSTYKPDIEILRSPSPENAGPSERRPDPFRGSYWRRDSIRPTLQRRPTKRELELKAQCNELLRKLKQKEKEIQQLKGYQRREQQAEIDNIERKLRRLSIATTASKTQPEASPPRHSSYSRPTSIIYFGSSRPSYAPSTRRTDALLPEEEAMVRAREQALRNLVSPKPAVTIPSTPWDIAQRLRGMAHEDKPGESRLPDPPRPLTSRALTPPTPRLPDSPNPIDPKPPTPPPKLYERELPQPLSQSSWNRPIRRSQYAGAVPLSPTARDEEPPTPKPRPLPRRRPHPPKSSRINLPKAKLWTVTPSALERAKETRNDTERAGRRGLSMLPLPSPPFARPPPDVPVSPCSLDPSTFRPEGTPAPVQAPAPNPYASPKRSPEQETTAREFPRHDKKHSPRLEPKVPPPSPPKSALFTPLDDRMPTPRSEPVNLRSVPPRTKASLRRVGSRSKLRSAENRDKTDTVKRKVRQIDKPDSAEKKPRGDTVKQRAKRTDKPDSATTSAGPSASSSSSPSASSSADSPSPHPSRRKHPSPRSPQGRSASPNSPLRQPPSPKPLQRGPPSPKPSGAAPAQTPQNSPRPGTPQNPYRNSAREFYSPTPKKTHVFGRRWRGFLRRRTPKPFPERLKISAPIPNNPYTHPNMQ